MSHVKSVPNGMPYASTMVKVFGESWEDQVGDDADGVIGVAIIKAISEGVEPTLGSVANYLCLAENVVQLAFDRLSLNGALKSGLNDQERASIQSDHEPTLAFYAGWASGLSGKASRTTAED